MNVMCKRFAALLLALCLACSMGSTAFAAQMMNPPVPAPVFPYAHYEGVAVSQVGAQSNQSWLGTRTLLIFGNPGCPNCKYTIDGLRDILPQLKAGGVNAFVSHYAEDVNTDVASFNEMLKAYKWSWETMPFIVHFPVSGWDPMCNLATTAGLGYSITTPFVVMIDAKGHLESFYTGYMSPAELLAMAKPVPGQPGDEPTVPTDSITINKTSAKLNKGKTLQLKATVSPKGTKYTWSSSDGAIAKVNSKGVVTAVGPGTAYITATTTGCANGICEITVNVPAKSVKLNKSKLNLTVGKKYTLTAKISPGYSTDSIAKWSSSKSTVASVANGVITAHRKGTATITVKTSNGKKATCKITVKAAPKAGTLWTELD